MATDWRLGLTASASAPEVSADWSSRDDRSLVRACLDGHPDAFAPIVERYQRQVYHVCYRFAGNHADAADLAQDVFIRAYRGLRGFKGASALQTWLYRIAVNVSLNRVGQTKPHSEPIQERYLQGQTEPPDATFERGEHTARVRAAIARLPPKQRATLILRIYHELPHQEIAAVLGTSVGATKANFFHALASLRKLLT